MSISLLLLLLIVFQAFQLLFLLTHDWVQLGNLNDVRAQQREDSLAKRLLNTLISAVPFVFLLRGTLQAYSTHAVPRSLLLWLTVGYGLLFAGELASWWIPYLFGTPPEQSDRFRRLFGKTHSFLRERKGMRPNTLHVILHATTVVTLICLVALASLGWQS